MKYLTLPAIVSVALLSACAGSPMAISKATPEELKKFDNVQLCDAYYHGRAPHVKAEIEARKFVTEDEWPAIEKKQVKIAMNEAAVHCAWGPPSNAEITITQFGEHKRLVYRASYGPSQYVYLTRGLVSMAK
jgi:hypothetical protein